ncbi:MAG: DUF11 domain-containing protein [Lewinellaceae bacterium]|nr:DUF11 domain-containing protein [Lewinellaceae bacterium]
MKQIYEMKATNRLLRLYKCGLFYLCPGIYGALFFLLFTPLALIGQDCVDDQITGPFFDATPVTGNPTILEYELKLDLPGTTNDIVSASVSWAVNPPANASILNVTNSATNSRVRLSITGPFTLSVSGVRSVNNAPYNCSFESNTNDLVADNPNVLPACSINVLFVLDESNSIDNMEADSVRQAVLDLLGALVGTGSSAAIVEFATFAQVYPFNGVVDYAPITPATINGFFTDYFDNEYRNVIGNQGGTNYEAAFNSALDVLNNGNNPPTSIVLFFTDGVPTFYSVPSGGDLFGGIIDGPGNINTAATATQAIAPANAIKAITHMLAIGVGPDVSANVNNLIAISGPDKYTPGNALSADYELVNNFDMFIQCLASIFSGLSAPATCRPGLPNNQLVDACNPSGIQLKTQNEAVDQNQIFENVTDAPCGVLIFTSNQTVEGALCPQGITVVNTYTLTDDADGDGVDPDDISVTCTESFLVTDVTPPTALCKDITLDIATLDGTASITAVDIDNGSSDNCGGAVTLSTNPATITFDCTDEGPNPVVLTVTDVCGNPSQCTATVTINCPDVADLSIEKTVDNTTPNVGDIVTFTITVTNDGPNDATGVQVTDNLPSGYMFISATPSQGTFVGGVWDIGSLPFQASVTLLLEAKVNAAGNYLNLAQITDSDQIDTDSDPFSDETVDDLGDGIPDDDEDTAEVIPNLIIDCPDNVSLGSCLTQNQIDQAFADWIAMFSVTGGCTPPVVSDLSQYDAPNACTGGSTNILFTASDDCGQSVSCSAAFIVAAAPTLIVNCPSDLNLGSCRTQAEVDAAFNTWLGQFSTSGGCNAISTDLGQYDAPDACGGSVTVNYSATDDCGQSGNCAATFTVAPAPTLTVSCPSTLNLDGCGTQTEVDAAFNSWLGQFDTNGGCNPQSTDLTIYVAPPASGGSVTVNYSATDACGQSAACSATFTVASVPSLSVSCPADFNFDNCASQGAVDAAFDGWLAQFTTSGGANPVSTDLTQFAAPDACGGSVTVDYSATDDCGQSASCSATFTVEAAPALTVVCPANFSFGSCHSQGQVDAAFDGWLAQFTALGGCNPQNPSLDQYTAPDACGGSVTVNYVVIDNCGQSASCSATFTVVAATDLVVNCPADFTLSSCLSPAQVDAAFNTWLSQFTAFGGCNPQTTDLGQYAAPSTCGGSVTVNFTAIDNCGQSESCSATFTVRESFPLVVKCPQNINIGSCLSQAQVDLAFSAWIAQFTVYGGCHPQATDLSQYTAPAACGGSVIIDYMATDDCGEFASCSSKFTVAASPAPVVSCPQDLTLGSCQSQAQVNAAFNGWKAQFATYGGCNTQSTDLSQFSAPGTCGGAVTINYTATDGCGQSASCSATFTVVSAPTLAVSCPTNVNLASCQTQAEVNAAFNAWKAQFLAFGGCNPQSTNLNQFAPPSACGGSVTITFAATDDCGQSAVCTSTFAVAMSPPLTVSCPQNFNVGSCQSQSQVNAAFNAWKAQFATIGGCNPQSTDLGQYSAPSACGGSVTINYTASNSCGQSASCSATFTVAPATPLSVSCPQNASQGNCLTQAQVNAAFNAWKAQFSVSGGCNPQSTNLAQISAPSACGGSVTINFTATDICGQSASCSATYTVAQAPLLSVSCPQNATQGSCLTQAEVNAAFNAWKAQFGVSGGCSPQSTNLAQFTAPIACGGSVTINYTATDNCGQSASCSATYTVIGDNVPPVVTPASNLTVQCDGNGNVAALNNWLATQGGSHATDNCGPVSWTNNFSGLSNGCGATGSATVTFTARDLCGNPSSTTATFTIVDTTPPTGTCPAGVTGLTGPSQAPVLPPAAIAALYSDICGSVTAQLSNTTTNFLSACLDFEVVQTYTITDECGNATTCKITHTGRVPTAITGGCPEVDDPLQCIEDVPDFDPAFLASFFTGGDGLPVTVSPTDTIVEIDGCSFTFTYEYLVTDNCGNSKTCTLVYEGEDTEAPTGTCPDGGTVYTFGQIPVPDTNYIKQFFTDNCSGLSVSVLPRTIEGGPCINLTVYNNYLISDACGNTTPCAVPYFIPQVDPTLVACPPAQTDLMCWKDVPTPQEAQPLVEYNFSPAATVIFLGSTVINNFCSFTIRHIYQIQDPCLDGRRICVLTFSGQDFTPPAGICPEGESGLECMANVPEPDPIGVALNYTDNCSDPFGYLINTIVEGDECGDFSVTYFYRIYDDCDNFVECYVTHTGTGSPAPGNHNEQGEKAAEPLQMALYPNPTSGSITLEFEHYHGELAELAVYNIYGQQMVSKRLLLNSATYQLDLAREGLSSGAYLISIRTDKDVVTRKVVLNKL